MDKIDFLEKCEEEAISSVGKAILDIFNKALKKVPNTVELNQSKNLQGFYEKMRDIAKRKQTNNTYAMTEQEAIDLAIEYLDVKKYQNKNIEIKFEDFF